MERPVLEVGEKKYEFICTRYLQAFFDEKVSARRKDEAFQRRLALEEKAKANYERMRDFLAKKEEEYFSDILNEDAAAVYEKAKELEEKAYNEYANVIASGSAEEENQKYLLDNLELLVIEALKEQHSMDEETATKTWEQYVTENGKPTAMVFLAYMADCFFNVDEGEEANPLIGKVKARNERMQRNRQNFSKVAR